MAVRSLSWQNDSKKGKIYVEQNERRTRRGAARVFSHPERTALVAVVADDDGDAVVLP